MYRKLDKPSVLSFDDISKIRNREDKQIVFQTDADTSLRDFYWRYDRGLEPYDTTSYPVNITGSREPIDEETKNQVAGKHFYEISFSNKGGLIMPIILQWTYKDGTTEYEKISYNFV